MSWGEPIVEKNGDKINIIEALCVFVRLHTRKSPFTSRVTGTEVLVLLPTSTSRSVFVAFLDFTVFLVLISKDFSRKLWCVGIDPALKDRVGWLSTQAHTKHACHPIRWGKTFSTYVLLYSYTPFSSCFYIYSGIYISIYTTQRPLLGKGESVAPSSSSPTATHPSAPHHHPSIQLDTRKGL